MPNKTEGAVTIRLPIPSNLYIYFASYLFGFIYSFIAKHFVQNVQEGENQSNLTLFQLLQSRLVYIYTCYYIRTSIIPVLGPLQKLSLLPFIFVSNLCLRLFDTQTQTKPSPHFQNSRANNPYSLKPIKSLPIYYIIQTQANTIQVLTHDRFYRITLSPWISIQFVAHKSLHEGRSQDS